jgi:hypothetical protein
MHASPIALNQRNVRLPTTGEASFDIGKAQKSPVTGFGARFFVGSGICFNIAKLNALNAICPDQMYWSDISLSREEGDRGK